MEAVYWIDVFAVLIVTSEKFLWIKRFSTKMLTSTTVDLLSLEGPVLALAAITFFRPGVLTSSMSGLIID
jgi:hypothetical protein